jgi:hypothetical protein
VPVDRVDAASEDAPVQRPDSAVALPDGAIPIEPTRWCATQDGGAAVAFCDDFDAPTTLWAWAPPWESVRLIDGDAGVGRADGGLSSLPHAFVGYAGRTVGADVTAQLVAIVDAPATTLTIGFDVRVDELVRSLGAGTDVTVARVIYGPNGNERLWIVLEDTVVEGELHGFVYREQPQTREYFANVVQLAMGVAKRIELTIDRPGATFGVRVNGTSVLSGKSLDFGGGGAPVTKYRLELGPLVGSDYTFARITYDNVLVTR